MRYNSVADGGAVGDARILADWCGIVGRGFDITYETPKSESLALFELGERAYDHLLILPAKSKGQHPLSSIGIAVD